MLLAEVQVDLPAEALVDPEEEGGINIPLFLCDISSNRGKESYPKMKENFSHGFGEYFLNSPRIKIFLRKLHEKQHQTSITPF